MKRKVSWITKVHLENGSVYVCIFMSRKTWWGLGMEFGRRWKVLVCPERMRRTAMNGKGRSRVNWLTQVHLS